MNIIYGEIKVMKIDILSMKLDFEDIENKIRMNNSKHYLVQGYSYYKNKWYRYVTVQTHMGGSMYIFYDRNGETILMPSLLYGDIYSLKFEKINKIRYIISGIKNINIRKNEGEYI